MHTEPLPEPLRSRPFAVREALRLGATRGRLRSPALQAPHHGVRSLRRAGTLVAACADVMPIMREGWTFSHTTAAGLWCLPLPEHPRDPVIDLIHVSTDRGRGPRRPGIAGHRVAPTPAWHLGLLPVVGPVEAWFQCARLLELDDLIALGDALLGRWSPYAEASGQDPALLAAMVASRPNERGAVRAREALALMRPHSWSPRETAIKLLCHRAGLPEPELNVRRYDRRGRALGRPDLSWPDRMVAVEYEGDSHRTDPETFARDIRRRERFADAGWRVVRVTKHDLRPEHLAELTERLLTAVAG